MSGYCADCGNTACICRAIYLDHIVRFNPAIYDHADHAWRQVGHCVYCECGERLYQGTKPDAHPTYSPPRKPSAADAMRERWGK